MYVIADLQAHETKIPHAIHVMVRAWSEAANAATLPTSLNLAAYELGHVIGLLMEWRLH